MKRPYVTHFSTMSVDGRIASSSRYSLLSCIYDKLRLLLLRGHVNAVMVGAGTVIVDDPGLAKRIGTEEPYYRVVVDGRLSTPLNARVYTDRRAETILVTSRSAPREKLEKLQKRGVHVIIAGEGPRVDLRYALETLLRDYGVKRVLVEGGGVLAYSLYRERLVDELRVTVAPVLFASGRSLVDDPEGVGFPEWRCSPRLRLVHVETCPCGNCIHMVYDVLDSVCCPASTPPPRELRKAMVDYARRLHQS